MGLARRNGHWYYRQTIPKDVQSYFGGRADISLSLKTKSKKDARLLSVGLEQQYLSTFVLIRTGILTPEQLASIKNQVPLRAPNSTTITPQGMKSPDVYPITKEEYKLGKLIGLYVQEKQPRWKNKTCRDFENIFCLILKVIGNKPVTQIDRKQCIDYRDIISGHKKSIIPSKKPYHPKTVNMHMTLLSSLFKWGVRCGYMQYNPAEGLLLSLPTSADEERKVFSLEDLALIKKYLPTDELYKRWIPILSMYTGMRLEEACSLRPDSFIEIDGIKCIHLVERVDCSLKSKSSERLIPLHCDLLEMGIWEYVQNHSASPTQNLWGLHLSLGKYGRYYGNWFGRFLRKYVTTDKKKVFHSFRHTFANSLKQEGVAESIIAELMGHKNDSITTGRYGKRYNPHVLLSAVSKLCVQLV